jgi:hypothetical protein
VLKRGGKVLGLSLILIFCILFIAIESIKELLPDPDLGELRDWKFGPNNSTEEETFISANITVANLKGDLLIKIIEDTTTWDVFYKGRQNKIIKIGKVSFTKFQERSHLDVGGKKQDSEKIILAEIDSGKYETIPIYFKIYNENLFDALYEHITENDEIGELEFQLIFSFDTTLKPFGIDINNTIPTKTTYPFKTDILQIFEEIKYFINIPETYSELFPNNPILNSLLNLSIYKDDNSSIILINRTINLFKKHTKTIVDIYLGEKLEWAPTAKPTTIQMKQKIIATGVFFWLNQFKKKLPERIDIYANKVKIGHIKFKPVEERKLGILYKKVIYDVVTGINLGDLSQWLPKHIDRNCSTNLSFYSNGKYLGSLEINKNLSVLGNISFDKKPLNWDDFKSFLSKIQYFFVIIITGITVFLFINYYSKRKNKRKN